MQAASCPERRGFAVPQVHPGWPFRSTGTGPFKSGRQAAHQTFWPEGVAPSPASVPGSRDGSRFREEGRVFQTEIPARWQPTRADRVRSNAAQGSPPVAPILTSRGGRTDLSARDLSAPSGALIPVQPGANWQLQGRAKSLILTIPFAHAEVAELVDAHDSGSCGGFLVGVRVSPSASSLLHASDCSTPLPSSASLMYFEQGIPTIASARGRRSRCSRRGLRGLGRRRMRRRTQGTAGA